VRRKKSSGKSGKTAIKKARLKRTDGKNEDRSVSHREIRSSGYKRPRQPARFRGLETDEIL